VRQTAREDAIAHFKFLAKFILVVAKAKVLIVVSKDAVRNLHTVAFARVCSKITEDDEVIGIKVTTLNGPRIIGLSTKETEMARIVDNS
jgi:hypothetical protein